MSTPPPPTTPPPSPQLEVITGAACALTLIFTALHILPARIYRGHCRGRAISFFHSLLPFVLTLIPLLLSLAALLALYIHRLLSHAPSAGSKNELLISALAFSTLFWSGLLGADRRRRIVAARLASIPCFGTGHHLTSHQILPHRSCLLSTDSLFLTPSPAKTASSLTLTTTTATEEASSPNSSPDRPMSDRPVGHFHLPPRKADRKRSSTLGITKRKVWEFSCRTATTWLFGRVKRQAWPLNVVRTFRTKSKRLVLIKDETIQDGAGAVLLIPSFTHSRDLDKPLIARVVFEAVNRCTPCVLNSWSKRFDGGVFHRFVRLPAVVAMITGDLRREVDKQRGVVADAEKCYMTEVLWAVITVEVLDYLQYKRRDLPMLTWLTQLPKWLCEHDAAMVESEVDAVFEEWKAGRLCGASLGRPCDSECCCHRAITRASCGCQCPCVCNCC